MIDLRIRNKAFFLVGNIPKGNVASYKEIAGVLRVHPRVIAKILPLNPHPIVVPCHRVVHADGMIGGYTPKGQKEKIKLLRKEGVKIINGKVAERCFYYFKT